ncbi:MAG TPA: DUF2339 domain-containing protein [Burkholderiales bacterium]|nr:DUF2339 domain-containing protein [Burkholderiales bacterium]
MWLIGLFIGAVLGGVAGGAGSSFFGAVAGTVLGILYSKSRKSPRIADVESRVAVLERAVADLRAKLSSAQPSKVEPEPEAAQPAPLPPLPELQVPPAPPVLQPTPGYIESAPARATPRPAEKFPPAPPIPTEPSFIERGWQWLTGGNALVRVGVIVLFFGVAFLLKYAYDHTQVPIEARLIGVAIGAIVMLVMGWRLRHSKPVYGLAMQGGGVGLLYLLVFGAFRLFNLIPGEAAFVMLAAIAILSAVLAVLQNAMSLAVLGVSGGFLAPVLASTGGGSHVALFGYYGLLNCGVLAIALFKAWRPLNVLGFVFTFGIGTVWGARFYRPEYFASTEPFLLLFFLQYLTIAVLFATRQAPNLKNYVDSTIVFGVPLVAFGLQTQLVKDIEYGAAWSAVAAAALYLVLARALYQRHAESLRMLVEAFLALGVIFATLAIPLAFDGRWTSAAWALEGAAAYWVGAKQGRRLPRAFGLLLQLAAGIAFVIDARREYGDMPIANSYFMGCVFIAAAALFCNRTIERHFEKAGHFAMQVSIMVFLWGLAWWLFAGLHEIDRHVPDDTKLNAALLFLTATCAVFSVLWGRGWVIARYPAQALAPVMLLLFAANVVQDPHQHVLAASGWLAWPVAFLFHFRILARHDKEQSAYRTFAHAAGVWLLAAIGAWESGWQIDQLVEGNRVWPMIAWAIVPGALLALIAFKGPSLAWPVLRHIRAYLWFGAGPLAIFLLGWTVYANVTSDGNPAPLPYLPLINPLEIAQLFAFATLAIWWRTVREQEIGDIADWPPSLPRVLLGGGVFIFLNCVLLRTIHHWTDIPYRLDLMLRYDLVQVALSIFWTVLALVAMVLATRRGLRVLWFCGATLMAVVVMKLFLVDLAKVGGIERIVLFIGVGVLMLVIGYFSPLPPRHKEAA